MEFKEFVKQKKRMCKENCRESGTKLLCNKECPMHKSKHELIYCDGFCMTYPDESEKIVEKWAKEHPVVTNADKYIEVLKNIFGGAKLNKKQVRMCVKAVVGLNVDCNTTHCSECMKWWDKEYEEPVKEKE